MNYLECSEQEVEFDGLKFEFSKQTLYCSGIAFHVVYQNDNGIGPYEYWGHRGNDVRIEWSSEESEMTLGNLEVYDAQNNGVTITDELMDKVTSEVFEYTKEKAEEKCG